LIGIPRLGKYFETSVNKIRDHYRIPVIKGEGNGYCCSFSSCISLA